MDRDVENRVESGRVLVTLRPGGLPAGPCPVIWIVEQRREARRDIVGLLVAWVAITLATLAVDRLFFAGW